MIPVVSKSVLSEDMLRLRKGESILAELKAPVTHRLLHCRQLPLRARCGHKARVCEGVLTAVCTLS